MSDTSVTPSFPRTDVSYNNEGGVKVYEALNPASFDKVRSLQISCPGLAAGVHINSEAGTSSSGGQQHQPELQRQPAAPARAAAAAASRSSCSCSPSIQAMI